jgi:DNA invertase Pin-like site-specific DNA recombinase
MSTGNSTDDSAVSYYRMSTMGQEASIPEQRQWALRAARANGLQLVAEFRDEGIPGSEIAARPGLTQLLDYCERQARSGRPVGAIVCWDADRLSRASSLRTAGIICRLMDAGVTRMLTNEGWADWTDDTDLLLFNIKQDTGKAAYSKSISRSATRSALGRARKGEWVAGRPPYAYVVGEDAHLVPGDEAMVETVRWVFRHFAASADSLGDVARKLRERGAPPPPPRRRKDGSLWGGAWTRYIVADILHNRAYLGEIVWNATHTGKYSKVAGGEVVPSRRPGDRWRRVVNGEGERIVVEGAHPPLIDADTFRACQEKLARTGPGRGPDGRCRNTPIAGGGSWVLSGFLFCGCCGGRMGGATTWARRGEKLHVYRRYVCRSNLRQGPGACRTNAVSQEVILTEVARLIRESFTDPKRRARLAAEVKALIEQEDGAAEAERGRLRKRLAGLARQIDRGNENLALLPADRIPAVVAKVRGWEEERDQLARELARLDAAAESGERFKARVADALEEIQALEEVILSAPPDEVRDALAGLVDKITLHFEHGPPMKGGKRRAYLASLDVALRPEARLLLGDAHLWSSGSRRR